MTERRVLERSEEQYWEYLAETGMTDRHDRYIGDSKDLWDAAWRAAQDEIGELKAICAETYQVVGSLAGDLGIFESSDQLVKVLDNLSQQKRVHADVLPWPSFRP